MKRLLSFLVVAGAAVGVQAQITFTISPSGGSVYSPEYYGNVVEVVYNDSIIATDAEALVTVSGESTAVPIVNVEKYGFGIDLAGFLSGKTDNLVFTVSVDGVVPMSEEVSSVDEVAASYLLRKEFPTATPNPVSGEVTNKAFELKVDFSEAVHVGQFGFVSGPRFAKQFTEEVGNVGYEALVTVPVKESYWKAETEESNLTVNLNEVSIEYNGSAWNVPNYSFSYLFKEDAATVQFLGVDPKPGTMTPWEVYADGWGMVSLMFDNEVEYEDALILVDYKLQGGETIKTDVPSLDLWGDWSFWTNTYNVEFPLPICDDATEANLISITITPLFITVDGTEIEIESIVYDASDSVVHRNTPNTAGVSLLEDRYQSETTIFSLDGTPYHKNRISDLDAGLYIINGKKVVIK